MTQAINAPMPITEDIRMKRGADFRMTIFAREDDGVTARDTTDWEMSLTIKASANGEQHDQLTVGDRITNTPAAGQFSIEIPAADVDAYDFTRATYDIIITDADSKKTCPFAGTVEVLP